MVETAGLAQAAWGECPVPTEVADELVEVLRLCSVFTS